MIYLLQNMYLFHDNLMFQRTFHSFLILGFLSCSQKEAQVEVSPEAEEEYLSLEKLRQNPEQTKEICSKTTNPAVLEQCTKINKRPHLYKATDIEKNRSTKYDSPLESVSPSSTQCQSNVVKCRTGKARIARTQEERVAECKSLGRKIWQHECLFETAESGLRESKLPYSQAAELCTLTGRLTYNCLQHLSIALADQNNTLRDSKRVIKTIESYWQNRDRGQSQKMKIIFWMIFIEMYINKKTEISQSIFTDTDSDLHPYIWAALTKAILETSAHQKTLEERSNSLLELHQGLKSIRLPVKPTHSKQKVAHKMIPRFTKEYNTVLYFGEQRRVLGSTVKEDVELCFVMAAYILQKHQYLITEAVHHPSKTVSTVAKNLE